MNTDVAHDGRADTVRHQPLTGHTAPIASIVVVGFIGLGFLIAHPDGLFNRYSDLLAFHLGIQTVLYDTWQASHRLPLWRSDILSGAPAFSNPQAMYTHPLHVLFLLARPERIVGLVIWLQLLLGALGGYYAGMVLRLSVPGRVLVAVSILFSFKTLLAVYAGWLTLLAGIAAMPFLFAATAVVLERPCARSALLFGSAGALTLHSGHPQFPYYSWLLALAWSVARIGRQAVTGGKAAGRIAITVGIGGVIAIGLSAYLLAPIAYQVPLVSRWNTTYTTFLGNRPVVPVGLLTLINPELFGTPLNGSFPQAWESVVYFGAVTSLLAILAAVKGRRRPYVLTLVIGVAVTVALGIQTPLTWIAYEVIPGFHLFRLPARMLFVGAFFVSCLAGVGVDIVLSSARSVQSRRIAAAFMIGLVAFEGTFWARRYLRVPEASPYAPRAEFVETVVAAGSPGRVAPIGRSIPDYGSAARLGLQLITGYDPFNLRSYQTYIELLQYGRKGLEQGSMGTLQPNWIDLNQITRFDLLDALNVRYVLASRPLAANPDEYALLASFDDQRQFRFYEGMADGPVYVYRNTKPLGGAFFVPHVVQVADEDAAIDAVLNSNLRTTAVVIGGAGDRASVADSNDRVDVLGTRAGELHLNTRTVDSRFLVISEVWLPGWRARMDGHPVSLQRVDLTLLGLWVPPGEHQLELHYWPPGLTAGLIVTGFTMLAVLGTVVLRFTNARHAA